tara:strand:+ start:788 stop:1120 length:333 start_codon:yes stop_codon:yes gene_type:complete
MTTTTETTRKIADVTLQQLGGRGRLSAMIGAQHFYSDNDGATLIFQFKGSRKANAVKITLNSLDTYDVEFVKKGTKRTGYLPTTVKEYGMVYADQLHSIFESFTGLYLSM